jgi:hypothetical protein
MKMPNLEDPCREFRVSRLDRYKVTDWSDYRGGTVTTVAEDLTLEQANAIAEAFGRAYPDALVNTMPRPVDLRAILQDQSAGRPESERGLPDYMRSDR